MMLNRMAIGRAGSRTLASPSTGGRRARRAAFAAAPARALSRCVVYDLRERRVPYVEAWRWQRLLVADAIERQRAGDPRCASDALADRETMHTPTHTRVHTPVHTPGRGRLAAPSPQRPQEPGRAAAPPPPPRRSSCV